MRGFQQSRQHRRRDGVGQELRTHVPALVDGAIDTGPLCLGEGVLEAHSSTPF